MLERGDLPQKGGLTEVPLPAGRRLFVQIQAKTRFCTVPQLRTHALQFVALASEEFEVAIELSTWVCVVVPACGFGWVPNASIVSRREMASKYPAWEVADDSQERSLPVAGANVKAFDRFLLIESEDLSDDEEEQEQDEDDEWRTGSDSIDAIKALLSMIGRSLQEFNYPSHDIAITKTDLSEILASCSNLKHLKLMGNALACLRPLIDRYQAQQCRIVSLNIFTVVGQDHVLSQLTELLESSFSEPLQYVAFNGVIENSELLDKLASAVKINQSLQLLYSYSRVGEQSEIFSRIQSEFEAVKRVSPLAQRSKLAFLGVIDSHARTESGGSGRLEASSSLGKLDSSIVSQIFAFASIPYSRTMIW